MPNTRTFGQTRSAYDNGTAPLPAVTPEVDQLAEWLAAQTWSDFATSLAAQYARTGRLSAKQIASAERMKAKCDARAAERAARPARQAAESGLNLMALFLNEDGTRKLNQNGNPIERLLVAVPGGDTRLKLSIEAPADGRWSGSVFVKDAAVYGQGRRYGVQRPGATYTGDVQVELAKVVLDLPAALAKYGHITSKCGVCNRRLEDKQSVNRGVGPICWGYFGGAA